MTASPQAAVEDSPPGDGRRRHTVALAVLSAAQLVFLLDATIVNVALPSIQQALELSGADLEWIVASYSIAFGGLLMLGGRLGDLLGRRRVFAAGLALFTVASLLGGLADTAWLLIACRTAQGIGAAAASPAALALIAVTFPEGPQRDRAVGWYTAVATAGGGVGLLAGGVITGYLSWRWVMFVNVPIGALILAAAPRVLRETPARRGAFDATGALTGTLAALLLVYGLIEGSAEGGQAGWTTAPVLAALAAAAVLGTVFVLTERRSAAPLVPLRLFADRTRFGTYAVLALISTAMFGIFFFLTLFLQRVWEYEPLDTALVYLPLTCLLVAGAKAGPRLVALLGARLLVCGGLLVAAAGMLWLSRIGASGGWATGMLVPTVLVYSGLGVTGVPLTLAALAQVADEDSGAASGLFSMARQIGGATGLAVLGTVVWATVHTTDGGAGDGGAASGGADARTAGADAVADAALAAGVERGFLVAAGVTLLALLIAAVTVPRRTAAKDGPPGEPGGTASAGQPAGPGAAQDTAEGTVQDTGSGGRDGNGVTS
ncbi:MFS transporter [Streptomyces sp. JJ36]|uniref:MFS transporter n=1 Tax=Streptomyces sp. JJ36 TaxID=2736645 RepID=UPI001F4082A5|nr:MFS transporter [Streptomyces sp. JJ36]MCF6522654.1 MFS transporter [Streptomyces sp. JJ36]